MASAKYENRTSSTISPNDVDMSHLVGQNGDQNEFTNIPLEELTADGKRKKKQPRRILHFSDGILEEYSTDEEEGEDQVDQPQVDPKSLTWGPWFWYWTVAGAFRSLAAADFCGEKLAWFFGITSPKYQYAIDEFHRIKEEEEEERKELEKERLVQEEVHITQVRSMEDGVSNTTSQSNSSHDSTAHPTEQTLGETPKV
ncbi:unnamed protein product [Owenia fusiformis]|uniref:Uncharacterized protein n=1 Tax=Owenia fusiformis TaxID=6347 RepID=A0A8J1U4B5_OWEFU|nr:unnamed protein product [Owenia fusiformis]